MDFVEFISDQRKKLKSIKYMEMLWSKMHYTSPGIIDSVEEELYSKHLPLDLTRFLQKCIVKLKAPKCKDYKLSLLEMDKKYLITLLYYCFENKDHRVTGISLLASQVFFLISTRYHTFYPTLFSRILEILKYFNSSESTELDIKDLMITFNRFLSNSTVPDNMILETVEALHNFSYYSDKIFSSFEMDSPLPNIGLITFASLQLLTIQQQGNINKLNLILVCLTSSLKSSTSTYLEKHIKATHQSNVRLFIKNNMNFFHAVIVNIVKFVCLSSDYDEYDAIAILIQELPCNLYEEILIFVQNTIVCDKVEFRRNMLNIIIPLTNHPHSELYSKLNCYKILENIVSLFLDKNKDVQKRALKVIATLSEKKRWQNKLNCLQKKRNNLDGYVIQGILFEMVDPSWNQRSTNLCYIQLTCNMLIMQEDFLSLTVLNRLRNICINAPGTELKYQIDSLNRLLEIYANKNNTIVIIYILSIFVIHMLKTEGTTCIFAEKLFKLILSNVKANFEEKYICNIITYLISDNFDVQAIIAKFCSANLLKNHHIAELIDYIIKRKSINGSSIKFLISVLYMVPYTDHFALLQKFQKFLNDPKDLSEIDLNLVLCTLIKILENVQRMQASNAELEVYRQIYTVTRKLFLEQFFSSNCIRYAIRLITISSSLLKETVSWESAIGLHLENSLGSKLKEIRNRNLFHSDYLARDIFYVAEIISNGKVKLSKENFKLLKRIVDVKRHTKNFADYLKKHPKMWSLCLHLYVCICTLNSSLVSKCIAVLKSTATITNNFQLQIVCGLRDLCSLHLQYYDPLVPYLFETLSSTCAYTRLISLDILIKLLNEDQLKLLDGHFYLLMAMLVDTKEIIALKIKTFLRQKFVVEKSRTICKYFVAGIIHYNLLYEHPIIRLCEEDKNMLKNQRLSQQNRLIIYHHLFMDLTEYNKFNIVKQIVDEILGINYTCQSPSLKNVLKDSIFIILFLIPRGDLQNINEVLSHEKALKYVETEILKSDIKTSDATDLKRNTIKIFMEVLFRLLYCNSCGDIQLCQDLLDAIVTLTYYFSDTIWYITQEESPLLKSYYKDLNEFYRKVRDKLTCFSLSGYLGMLQNEHEDVEFYIEEPTKYPFYIPNLLKDRAATGS